MSEGSSAPVTRRTSLRYWGFGLAGALLGGSVARQHGVDPELLHNLAAQAWRKSMGEDTVQARLEGLSPRVAAEWSERWTELGWEPTEVALLAFKDVQVLEAYGRTSQSREWRYVASWPVLRQSGRLGPKRRAGDMQVPEGVYRMEAMNPSSRFHLALRVSYPNERDRAEAVPGTQLGGDIMIHGSRTSTGCLAMGNEAMERIFYLAAMHGTGGHLPILIAPSDWRRQTAPANDPRQQEIASALSEFPLRLPPSL